MITKYQLMRRHNFAYILMLLVALQSVAGVWDSHQFHQSGSEHLTFEHSHEQSNNSSPDELKVTSNLQAKLDKFDCHHCCHCHGVAQVYLPNVNENLFSSSSRDKKFGYRNTYLSITPSQDNPPPIS